MTNPNDYGNWIWSHNGPFFNVVGGTFQDVCLLRWGSEQMDIDAIVVRKE